MVIKCFIPKCPFYANIGCQGTCSEHSLWTKKFIILSLKPHLPNEIVANIFLYIDQTKKNTLTDDEILIKYKLNDTILRKSDTLDEREFWLAHNDLPYLHCDNEQKAFQIIGLKEKELLRKEDAIRLMNAIDKRYPESYTRIAMEKAIVMNTFHRQGLPKSMFPIGLCYFGSCRFTNRSLTIL